MAKIEKWVVVGASGNFGKPITSALQNAGYSLTIISRPDSTTSHPPGIPVLRPEYTTEALTEALSDQDAVVFVVGPAGVHLQSTFIDAAYAAGVKRFIIDDFGWGPNPKSFQEFGAIHAMRKGGWDYAAKKAEEGGQERGFAWTGISTGNPIDWALKKFPLMGFNTATRSAIIYDNGTEQFTGTTLEGIGQAVVGVLDDPTATANRFVKVASIHTCQNDLLNAFEEATGRKWEVQKSTTNELKASGQSKNRTGTSGWILELIVAQMFDQGEARCVVAPSRKETDSDLLGVKKESANDVASKVLSSN